MITSKVFWIALGERALKTFCQAFLASLGLGPGALDLLTSNWQTDLMLAVSATVLSVLTSITSTTPIVPTVATTPAPAPVPDPGPYTQPLYPYADHGQHEGHDV